MLQELKVHPTIPVNDLDKAREFYEGVLGFSGNPSPAGVMYACAEGTRLLVFPSSGAGKSGSTAAGFQTEDISSLVKNLQAKGVKFEEYNFPQLKTKNGIAETAVGKAAWFKDPDGNILGLVQFNK